MKKLPKKYDKYGGMRFFVQINMHKYAFPRYINSDRTFDLQQLTDKINLKRHLIEN